MRATPPSEATKPGTTDEKNGLANKGPGKKCGDERAWEAGDHQQHGVAENVAVEHLALGAALGARGEHILLAQFLQKRVLGQERYSRKGRQAHRGNRQNQMPEVVEDFLPPRQLRPGVGHETAQWEDLKERAAGE